MKGNSGLRAEARRALSGNWGDAVVVALVYGVVGVGLTFIPFLGDVASLLISIPLAYGLAALFLGALRGGEIRVGKLFDGFNDYGRVLGTMLLMAVYVILWTLLLIVPGIVKAYSYALTPYILKDRPDLKYNGAIEESMRLMNGHKMQRFLLDLSFIGWALLCILTLGIGFLWLTPYAETSRAAFYKDLVKDDPAYAAASTAEEPADVVSE